MTDENAIKLVTKEEYISLRQEILRLKGQRFTVVGASITLITALFGWVIAVDETPPWLYISAFVLFLLTCGCELTRLMGRDMVRIGTYLQVFYDSPWERRLEKFEDKGNWRGTNTILGVLYIVLALVSCFLLRAVGRVSDDQGIACTVFIFALIIFLASAIATIFYSYDREKFLKKWTSLRNEKTQDVNLVSTVPTKD